MKETYRWLALHGDEARLNKPACWGQGSGIGNFAYFCGAGASASEFIDVEPGAPLLKFESHLVIVTTGSCKRGMEVTAGMQLKFVLPHV